MALSVRQWTEIAKVRVAEIADPQFGRIRRAQLREIDVSNAGVARWLKDGYLFPELPHVYAVGSRARTVESDLAAALLYAVPGAALSHATAAWWLGLLEERPRTIQVSTPRRCRSLPGIRVYDRRERTRILHKRLATTTVAQVLLDLGATASLRVLRKALASAEYHKLLDLRETEQVLKRGSRGASKLRTALRRHQPRLAYTKSELELMLVELCEDEELPIPEINVKVAGWEVDALWRDARLAAELRQTLAVTA